MHEFVCIPHALVPLLWSHVTVISPDPFRPLLSSVLLAFIELTCGNAS